jgi:hypothetical protein
MLPLSLPAPKPLLLLLMLSSWGDELFPLPSPGFIQPILRYSNLGASACRIF